MSPFVSHVRLRRDDWPAAQVYNGRLAAVAAAAKTSPALTGISPSTFHVIAGDFLEQQQFAPPSRPVSARRAAPAIPALDDAYGTQILADAFRRNFAGQGRRGYQIHVGEDQPLADAYVGSFKLHQARCHFFVASTAAFGARLCAAKHGRGRFSAGSLGDGDQLKKIASNVDAIPPTRVCTFGVPFARGRGSRDRRRGAFVAAFVGALST